MVALKRSSSFLRSFTKTSKQNAVCLGYKAECSVFRVQVFKLSIIRKVVTDDELFSSFKVSERFAGVLPEDHASGLSLSSPARTPEISDKGFITLN